MIDISTTLLVVNSLGAVAGPVTIMMMISLVGDYALHTSLSIVCAATVITCLLGIRTRDAAENPTPVVVPMSDNSVGMAQAVAELVEEETTEDP